MNIKILVLEHDDDWYNTIREELPTYWAQLGDESLDIAQAKTKSEAVKILLDENQPYHIFISDIFLPPIGRPSAEPAEHDDLGLTVLKDVYENITSRNKLVMVGYSLGNFNKHRDLKSKCLKFADIFEYRQDITHDTLKFCGNIRKCLISKGLISDNINLKYDENEAGIASIVHEIGKSNLISLYKVVTKNELMPVTITAKSINQGMSGAYVIKVDASNTEKRGILMKIDRSRQRLHDEIKNYPHNVYTSRLVVDYLQTNVDDIAESNGWYAIGATFESESDTMLKRLCAPHSNITTAMEALFFEGGLSSAYKRTYRSGPSNAIESLYPNHPRRSRIRTALNTLNPLIDRLRPDESRNIKHTLDEFLNFKRIGIFGDERISKKSGQCFSHGDLHLKNVLITGNSAAIPLIIDTANFGYYHWSTDYTRLTVDMILSAYDYGPNSYMWDHLDHWVSLSKAICYIEDSAIVDEHINDDNGTIKEAIIWMLTNKERICPILKDDPSILWELQLAFAVEFMRGSYRQDLTDPKRLLGLLAGYHALAATESTLRKTLEYK